MKDPFASLVDEQKLDDHAIRTHLLHSARRGYAPLRKIFVQQPDTEASRASILAEMVRSRQERAVDALLLVHALEPVLGDPLPLSTWAKILGSPAKPCNTAAVTRAFDALVERNLVTRQAAGRVVGVRPLMEDGSGSAWTRPGTDPATVGKGYLTIPHEYWTTGLADRLDLPGKAMLLIMLSETTKKPTFSMAVERAKKWYGISERTAERGYQQLRREHVPSGQPLLLEHKQVVVDVRSPTGLRPVWHRALADPFSQHARAKARAAASRAIRRREQKAGEAKLAKRTGATRTTARKTIAVAPTPRPPATTSTAKTVG